MVGTKGKDCANPSEVAPAAKRAILPDADGSLALKDDTVLPSAPPGRDHYGDRSLERWVSYPKAKRKGHQELDPIALQDLATIADEQHTALRADSFCAEQMECALYKPGELDTPVNFTVDTVREIKRLSPTGWPHLWHGSTHTRLGKLRSPYGSPSDGQPLWLVTGRAQLL